MIKYLNEHTWLGAVRIKTDLGGLRKTVTWLPLIQPALIEFFLQLEASQASKLYTPSYILCIDSLATKFEGLLRDFCERAAVPTSELKTKGMQTKFINAILEHQLIREHFSEDDLLLFYYVLTDKGQDIRNNVAHTFYEPANYTFEKMALLIFALFRIGQYEAE
jgi:DNA-binding MarR family transcriptional regulator